MWVAKIKINTNNTLIGSLAVKYKIDLYGFPLSYYYNKNEIIVHMSANIFGIEKDKNNFTNELKKQQRLINIEKNNDFIIMTIKEPNYMKCLYNKDIIHVNPGFISSEGYEIGEIASFNRESLIKLSKILKEKYNGSLISIKKKSIKSVSIMKISPELTEKQRNALNLAIKNGYYNIPRKISVEELSKIAKLSFSTFQVHLRKSESKIISKF
jgi:predicted DNA binding protein